MAKYTEELFEHLLKLGEEHGVFFMVLDKEKFDAEQVERLIEYARGLSQENKNAVRH